MSRPARSVMDMAGLFRLSYILPHHLGGVVLQLVVSEGLQGYRQRVFVLTNLQFAETMCGEVKLCHRMLFHRNVAVLVLYQLDYDVGENDVAVQLCILKRGNTYVSEDKDGKAEDIATLARFSQRRLGLSSGLRTKRMGFTAATPRQPRSRRVEEERGSEPGCMKNAKRLSIRNVQLGQYGLGNANDNPYLCHREK